MINIHRRIFIRLFNRAFPSKEMKLYRKEHRKHKKELVKLTKNTYEWDYGYFHRMVIMQIKHMLEYYSDRNNVWQSDESRLPIVEQLQRILDIESEINRLDEELSSEAEPKISELYKELYGLIGENLRNWWD